MKKLLALIIALITVFSLAACTNGSKGNNNGGNKPQTTPDAEETYPLPEADFDAKDFRIGMIEGYQIEFYTMLEDESDPIDYALYQRNKTVEDRFNVTITPVYTGGTGYTGHVDIILNSIMSDTDEYDLTSTYTFASGNLVMSGALRDWASQKYTNLDASYWVGSINDNFSIEDHIYTAVGDTNVTSIIYTYGILMNRTLGNKLKVANGTNITDDVFATIRDEEWTIDYFNNVVAGVYQDIDDEPGKSHNDLFGLNCETLTNVDMYNFAFDLPMIDNKGEELLEFVYNKEKASTVTEKILDLYWNNQGTLVNGDYVGNFPAGRALFITCVLEDCFRFFRNMEDDYIILPYPMLDENQDDYYTGMLGDHYVLGMPVTCADPDFASFVTEAINIEAERYMVPAYYEQSLQGKFATDETSLEMLQLLMDGRREDFGSLFQANLDNVSCWLRWVVQSKENGMFQYIDERAEYMDSLLSKIIDKYREGAAS